MIPVVHTLLDVGSAAEDNEEFHTLLKGGAFRLESIVSKGQSSESNFWYDQPDPEWVFLLRGNACLSIEGEGDLQLCEGDYLLIPAHCRHRVQSTSRDALWLALHHRP